MGFEVDDLHASDDPASDVGSRARAVTPICPRRFAVSRPIFLCCFCCGSVAATAMLDSGRDALLVIRTGCTVRLCGNDTGVLCC